MVFSKDTVLIRRLYELKVYNAFLAMIKLVDYRIWGLMQEHVQKTAFRNLKQLPH